jgi:predicted nucleic acid-binding protein
LAQLKSLVDTSLWIDLIRHRSSETLKSFVQQEILKPDTYISEPIYFELLAHASEKEAREIERQLEIVPLLDTNGAVWQRAVSIGRACRRAGFSTGSFDILIAAVAIQHDAELVTFDKGFQHLARHCELRCRVLTRPEES